MRHSAIKWRRLYGNLSISGRHVLSRFSGNQKMLWNFRTIGGFCPPFLFAPWQMPWKSLYLTIWDIFTVYTIIHAFITKCAIRSKYERVQLCCALSVRQITRRNALKVRVFFGSSALLPALKSVQNRCEIFNGFYLKFRPIKVYRGGFKNFCNKIFDIF